MDRPVWRWCWLGVLLACSSTHCLAAHVVGEARSLDEVVSPRRPPLEAHILPAYAALQQTLLAVLPNAVAAAQPQQALKLMRHSVLGTVRAQTLADLRAFKGELERTVSVIQAAVQAAHPPTHDDYVQATPAYAEQAVSAVVSAAEVAVMYEDPSAKKGAKK